MKSHLDGKLFFGGIVKGACGSELQWWDGVSPQPNLCPL